MMSDEMQSTFWTVHSEQHVDDAAAPPASANLRATAAQPQNIPEVASSNLY
jgi:hypothetical protein